MVDLDKQFAAMADVSEEDTAYDFVIDEDLRVIAVPERGVVLGVEGDKDANRIRFRMNKTWRGYDMSKFDLRINYQNANGDKNYYTVTSKHTEGNAVVFDWIVAADAVAYQGDVFFIVVGLITTGGRHMVGTRADGSSGRPRTPSRGKRTTENPSRSTACASASLWWKEPIPRETAF